MKVLILDTAQKELTEFDSSVRNKFYRAIQSIESNKPLSINVFKKLNETLLEVRVKDNKNIFRGIGAMHKSNFVFVLFYQKKSQKMPQNYMQLAYKRFNIYKNYN